MFSFNSPEYTVFIRIPVKIAFTGGISIPVELTGDLIMVSSRLFPIKGKERSKHAPCFSPPRSLVPPKPQWVCVHTASLSDIPQSSITGHKNHIRWVHGWLHFWCSIDHLYMHIRCTTIHKKRYINASFIHSFIHIILQVINGPYFELYLFFKIIYYMCCCYYMASLIVYASCFICISKMEYWCNWLWQLV